MQNYWKIPYDEAGNIGNAFFTTLSRLTLKAIFPNFFFDGPVDILPGSSKPISCFLAGVGITFLDDFFLIDFYGNHKSHKSQP